MAKVLYIGFGMTPFVTGGAILYQESVVRAFRARGLEAVCFYAVPRHQLLPRPTPFVREWQKGGIRYIELVNPPHHFGHRNNPQEECRHRTVQKLTDDILDQERPDLVHIHELQMHTASTIASVVARGIPLIKTIHNYYDLCPQRDLMFRGETTCEDFKNGRHCISCLEGLQRNKLHLYYPTHLPLKRTFNSMAEGLFRRFTTRYPAEDYARRRHYFIEQLNRLSCIHCSSEGSATILKKHGVNADRIQVIPIATETTRQIIPKPLRHDRLPVVFGFVGGPNRHKGYEILLDAFARLDQCKAKLLVWNTKKTDAAPVPGLNIEFRGRFLPAAINTVFQEIDIGLIPSIWQEIFGLIGVEWLAAKIPVIGSDIGGIPQWLTDWQDGFLVTPGDPAKLAETMNRFVQQPTLIAEFQRKIRIPQSFDEHVERLSQVYEALLAYRHPKR